MMASQNSRPAEKGFTLIEVIITLVVFSILAVILASAMGSSLTSLAEPILRLQRTMSLQQTMENIRTDFAGLDDLAALKTAIGSGQQNNGYGAYEVIDNTYVKFTGYSETAGAITDGILKVTIKDSGTGVTLTELFVKW